MIIEYHRPDTIEEALHLLSRRDPVTLPMGGGTWVNRPSDDRFAVVDLQSLGMDKIRLSGLSLVVGATTTLEQLNQNINTPQVLKKCIQLECTANLRHMRTVAGTIVTTDARSPFVTTLLALDTTLMIEPGKKEINLGNLLPMRNERLVGQLILQIVLPINVNLAYHYVARTPADLPIVCVAAAQWPSGRVRIALGGYGDAPKLALDGQESAGAEEAVKIAYHQAGDQWASAEYRKDVAVTLTRRCLAEIAQG